MNHPRCHEHLHFIESMLKQEYDLEASHVEPINCAATDPPVDTDFVYRLDFTPAVNISTQKGGKSGTSPLPPEVTTLAIRLDNPATQLRRSNRIENEVAAMYLVRIALDSANLSHLVPDVYGWGSAADSQQGWILVEYKAGVNIHKEHLYLDMTPEGKDLVLFQFAEVISEIQQFYPPETITQYGGLTFSASGSIISAPTTLPYGGPFPTYTSFWHSVITSQLAEADKSPVLSGWRNTELRSRIETFLGHPSGLRSTLYPFSHSPRKYLILGALSTANLLFDPTTFELTAILNFGSTYISANPADEFLRSFSTESYSIPLSPYTSDPSDLALRTAILTGKFSSTSKSSPTYNIARLFDYHLSIQAVQKPSTIPGFEELASLHWFSDSIAKVSLVSEALVQSRGEEETARLKARVEVELATWLGERGF